MSHSFLEQPGLIVFICVALAVGIPACGKSGSAGSASSTDVVFRNVRGAIGEVTFGDRTPRDGPKSLALRLFLRGELAHDTASAKEGRPGSAQLALQLSNGTTLASASYTLVGPGGYTKSASIDVSNSSKISAAIGGLPAGDGYSITISATSTDDSTSCGGAVTFDVLAGQRAFVTVALTCNGDRDIV